MYEWTMDRQTGEVKLERVGLEAIKCESECNVCGDG